MLSKFDYYKPDNLEKATEFLDQNPGTKILAGGTDLIILLRKNAEVCQHILDIKGIPEANILTFPPSEGLFIGASITVNQIAENDEIRHRYPALSEAADVLASYQIRNRATLVGNICNASPGADLAPPLLVYNANVHIVSTEGSRSVGINEFFTGVKKTILKENEIVIGVSIPYVEPEDRSIYLRKSRIKGHDLCNVGLAMRLTADEELLLAIGAVATTPLRLTELEESIKGRGVDESLSEWIEDEIKKYMNPRRNSIRSSPEYRLHIAGVLAKRGLRSLMERRVKSYV